MEKGEFANINKYEGAEVETVAVAAAIGGETAAVEEKPGFTDKDYSTYDPDKEVGKKAAAKPDADLVEKHNIDEDKLYEE
jgi:hypothetical protein